MNKMKNKKLFSKIGTYIIFILFAFITVLPFLWMVSTAFKYEQDVFRFPIEWIPRRVRWENFTDVFEKNSLYYILRKFFKIGSDYYSIYGINQCFSRICIFKIEI